MSFNIFKIFFKIKGRQDIHKQSASSTEWICTAEQFLLSYWPKKKKNNWKKKLRRVPAAITSVSTTLIKNFIFKTVSVRVWTKFILLLNGQ